MTEGRNRVEQTTFTCGKEREGENWHNKGQQDREEGRRRGDEQWDLGREQSWEAVAVIYVSVLLFSLLKRPSVKPPFVFFNLEK